MSDCAPNQAADPVYHGRSRLKRWYWVHKWISLICTLFLLASCLTGLPLIFHDELAVRLGDSVEPPMVAAQDRLADLDVLLADARIRRPAEPVQFVFREGIDPV